MARRSLSFLVALTVLPHAIYASSAVGNQAARKIVAADNQFAFRLFHAVTRDRAVGNTFLSPASAALALAMTYNGAGGATQRAMGRALSLDGLSLPQINRENAGLLDTLKTSDPQVRLNLANDLWADTDVRFKPQFARDAQRYYGAGVTTLNLHGPAAVATINGRISRETEGKIPHLLSAGDLTDQTGAVLTNAAYFHGRWTETFHKNDTRPGSFTRSGAAPTRVPMMQRTGQMSYFQGDGLQAVQLPYGSGRFALDILLPAPGSSLGRLLPRLNAARWRAWTGLFRPAQVDLTLPHFQVTSEIEMKSALAALGMGIAFTPQADFRPMSATPLYIAKVKQQALLNVNENGTTAAAATAVIMNLRGIARVSVHPIIMQIDQPFFCVLRDTRTGAILFMGTVTDPG